MATWYLQLKKGGLEAIHWCIKGIIPLSPHVAEYSQYIDAVTYLGGLELQQGHQFQRVCIKSVKFLSSLTLTNASRSIRFYRSSHSIQIRTQDHMCLQVEWQRLRKNRSRCQSKDRWQVSHHFRDIFGWRVFANVIDIPGQNKRSSSILCISERILSYAIPKTLLQGRGNS